MYKKIKATKNNNLKKASVFAAMAVLASCAVMMNPEQLLTGDSSSGSTFANNTWWGWASPFNVNPRFFNKNSKLFYGPGGFASEPSLSDSNSKSSAELFDRIYKWLESQTLGIFSLQSDFRGLGGLGDIQQALSAVLQWIGKNSGYSDQMGGNDAARAFMFENFAARAGVGRGVGSRATYLGKYCGVLSKLAGKLYELLDLIRRFVKLPPMKNSEKLEELKNLKKNSDKNYTDVIKMIGLDKINQGGARDGAITAVENAISLFFEGEAYNELDNKQNSDMFSVILNALSNNTGNTNSNDLSQLKSALAVIVQINWQINRFIRQCATLRTLLNWAQAIESLRAKISDGNETLEKKFAEFVAILEKAALFKMFGDGIVDSAGGVYQGLGYGELAFLPLFGCTPKELNKLSGAGVDKFRDVRGQVVGAFSRGESPANVLSASETARSAASYGGQNGNRLLTYDIGTALTSIFNGDTTFVRDVLSGIMDKKREEAFQTGLKLIDFSRKASDAEKKQIQVLANAYDNNAGGKYKFVSKNGDIATSMLEVDAFKDMSLFSELLGQPATIVSMALGLALESDLSNGGLDGFWQRGYQSAKPWINGSDLKSKISIVCNKLSEAHGKYKDLTDEVQKIKDKKPDAKKKEKAEASKDDGISQILALNGNDTVNTSVTATPIISSDSSDRRFVSMRIEGGIDPNVAEVSPVLCPKTDKPDTKDKDGKVKSKDVELPRAKVVNGVATIDLSNVLHDTGLYELHVRNVKKDENKNDKYEFAFKIKFFNNSAGVKHTKKLKATVSQGSNAKIDTASQTPVVYKNSDNSMTVKGKLKKDVDGSKLFGVVFEQDKSPNLEKDQVGVQYNPSNGTFKLTTSPEQAKAPKTQIHLYSGKLEAPNFVGKFEVDQSKASDISVDEDISFSSALTKSGASTSVSESDNSFETQEKVLQLKIPTSGMASNVYNYGYAFGGWQDCSEFFRNRNVTIKFLNNNDQVVKTETVKLDTKVSEEGDSNNWFGFGGGKQSVTYKVTLNIPVSEDGYKLRISDIPAAWSNVSSLDSSDKVSSKTESEKVINFSTVNKSGGSFWNLNSWF